MPAGLWRSGASADGWLRDLLARDGWCPHCGVSLRDDAVSSLLGLAGLIVASALVLVVLAGHMGFPVPLPFSAHAAVVPVLLISLVAAAVLWEPLPVPPDLQRSPPLPPVAGMARIEFFPCPACKRMSLLPHGSGGRMLVFDEPIACPVCRANVRINPRWKCHLLLTLWVLVALAIFVFARRYGVLAAQRGSLADALHLSVLPWSILLAAALNFRLAREPVTVAGHAAVRRYPGLHGGLVVSLLLAGMGLVLMQVVR